MGEAWHGLITKPKRMMDWLRNQDNEIIIWSDSFDVIFPQHPQLVVDEYKEIWSDLPVVYNAEKGLFPRSDLASSFPECGTPWRYLNSGLIIGQASDILRILEWMPLDDTPGDYIDPDDSTHRNPNDQGWHQMAYSAQPVPMVLDSRCQIFQTYSACTIEEFGMNDKNVVNLVTQTCPIIHHFNGSSKSDGIMDMMLSKWGL